MVQQPQAALLVEQLDLFNAFTAPHLDWFSGVDLDAPHKPQPGEKFAYVTDFQDVVLQRLNLYPCAQLLYRYYLRLAQAGREVETSLREFQKWTVEVGNGGYSLRHVRRAFKQLEDHKLISVSKKYLGSIYRLLVRHVGPVVTGNTASSIKDKNVPVGTSMSQLGHPCPKQAPQTLIPTFPITENSENLDQQTEDVVVGSNEIEKAQPGDMPTSPASFEDKPELRDQPIDPHEDRSSATENNAIQPSSDEFREILTKVRDMGMIINPTLQRMIKTHYSNAGSAIAHIKERIARGEQFKSLEGAFTKACREGARPERIEGSWGAHAEINPPSSDDLATLEEAKARGEIKDYFLSTDNICKVVLKNGFTQMPWWEYFDSIF